MIPKVTILLENDEENFDVRECNARIFDTEEEAKDAFEHLVNELHGCSERLHI